MNHLFFPNRPKPATGKTGISRVRKIIKYEKKTDKNTNSANNNNAILHNNIPSPWFYNKSAADKVWDGLEQTDKEREQIQNKINQIEADEKEKEEAANQLNPYSKIDKSTNKIRQLVESFNVTDQEFLLNLMELLEDDTGIDNLDQQSILLEARLRLATMIDEHVGNSDAQSKMLDSLRFFFNDFQQESHNAIETEITNLSDFDNGVDSAQLATLINDACEKNEVCSEQASHIHKSIVDSFTRQMRDLKQEIDTRDKEIQNLQNQIETNQKSRRNRCSDVSAHKIKEANQMLASAQRKICEQQNIINNLRSALKIKDGKEDDKDIDSSLAAGLLDVKLLNDNENDENSGSNSISSDREFELMTKIHYLTEQVQMLKSDAADSAKEIKELKFASIDLNNNYQALERMKKTADKKIESLNEKYEFMENMYKKKLSEAGAADKVMNEKSEVQIIADLKIEYENKISSIREQARQTQQQALDIAEKRHRMQMNDMLKSLENADQSAALSEVMKNQESSINEVTERHKKQVLELKNMNNDKIRALTKQYEAKLIDAFKQNESLRSSLKDDIAASLLKQKIELEADFQKKLNDSEANADDKFEKMRQQLFDKLSSLENLNKKLMNERDALRDALDEAQVVVDIPTAEDELADENEEEEEEFENDNKKEKANDLTDEIKLFDKNWADQQVRKVKDEYNALMNQQRENIIKTKEWELEQMKKAMIRTFDEQMAENRRNLISDLTDLRDSISKTTSPSDVCDQLDTLISKLLNGVEKQSEMTDDIVNREPTILLSEANEKMDELNKKIVEVSTENEFLRSTLGKLANNRTLKDGDGNDIVKIMRQSIAEEAEKINELLLENGNIRSDLEKAKTEINELVSQKDELFKQNESFQEEKEKYEKEINLLKAKISQYSNNEANNDDSSFSGSISMPIKPSYMIENVSNDDYNSEKNISCSKCGEKISVNPIILQVSTVETPVVECPFCHEAVQINRTDINPPFPKEEFNQQQLEQIGKMENEIKSEVMNLIEIKKQMREGVDLSSCQKVIQIDNTKEEKKTITLTPNYDITVFTLPPMQKTLSNKLQKNSSSVPNARSFSPSSNRHFTSEQVEKILQIEDNIDKKINNLVDFKVKSSGSSNNIKIVDDGDASLKISKEIFFDSSNPKSPNKKNSAHFVIFENNPNIQLKGQGRMIAASKSCNIFRSTKDRVSFNVGLIKPPTAMHYTTKYPANQHHEEEDASESETKPKFAPDFNGTSLDGSQSPFTRSLSDIINTGDGETVSQQTNEQNKGQNLPALNQSSKQQSINNDQNSASIVKPALPPLESSKSGQTRPGLPKSNALSIQQLQKLQKPVLSRTNVMSFDILPWERTTIEDAHIEKGGNVLARLQSQFLRSQQQIPQIQPNQTSKEDENKNVFLTPEADLISLQVSEASSFSRRSSRPSSSSSAGEKIDSPKSKENGNEGNEALHLNLNDDVDLADRLFEKNKPTGDPKAIEEFRADLDSWKRQMYELKDQYKSMTNSYNEVNTMAHELIQRHNEIVKVLTKALDTAMSLAHGDAEHPEALIEKMQEQSAYLTTAIREKEILHSQSNEQLLVINERMQEVMQMHGETAEKEEEINRLEKELESLTAREKENKIKIHEFEENEKSWKDTDEFQKNQINSIAEKLEFECKKNFESQSVIDNLNVKIEHLQSELVIASKASEVDMTSVDPFVIFSINMQEETANNISNNKYKGFGLQPKSSDNIPTVETETDTESKDKDKEKDEKEKDNDNEVIHISSFKKDDKKNEMTKSSESFAVFQPEYSEESDSKMIYTSSKLQHEQEHDNKNENEQSETNDQIDNEKELGASLSCQLAINQTPVIGGRIVENQKAQNLKVRIQQLETSLAQKANENSEVREELHTTQQHLFKITNMNAKIEREMKKIEVQREVTVKKLQDSMELVTKLSTENESLRKLVEQYKQMSLKFAEDLKKASCYEQSKNIALIGEMKTRSLLRDIENSDPANYNLKNFAERQALSLARWEGKRRYMQEKERQKIMSALQALNFIHLDQKSLEKMKGNENGNGMVRKKSLAPGMKVTTYNIKKFDDENSQSGSQASSERRNIKLASDRSRSMPSFDEALKNANSHNQKVSKYLQLGIVANPLKV